MSVIGRWWEGAGPHTGHIIHVIEVWEPKISYHDGPRGNVMTCGRVRCNCGVEWDVGGWPV